MAAFDIIQASNGIQYAITPAGKAVYFRPYKAADWFRTSVKVDHYFFDRAGRVEIDESAIDPNCPVHNGFNLQEISDYLKGANVTPAPVKAGPCISKPRVEGESVFPVNGHTLKDVKAFNDYAVHIARRIASGDDLAFYPAPCCGSTLVADQPPRDQGGLYDTHTTCPVCANIFFRVVERKKGADKSTITTNLMSEYSH